MDEVLRTNDAVLLSFVQALLEGEGIAHMVLDGNMSVLEGSLGVIPRRVLVADDKAAWARVVLTRNGLGDELRPSRV